MLRFVAACAGIVTDTISLSLSHGRLLVALQKAGQVRGSVDLAGDSGWEEDVDDLLRDAAAAAAAGDGFDW